MKQIRIPLAASLLLLFVTSCAENMDDTPPGVDSTAVHDSIAAAQTITIERLTGVWISTQNGKREGFYLAPQGKLTLQNIYTTQGETWELVPSDSLRLTVVGTTGRSVRQYRIISLTDSVLTLATLDGKTEIYTKTAKTHYEFKGFRDEFRGSVQASQIVRHTFSVDEIFDGILTIEPQTSVVRYRLLKDGIKITESSSSYKSSFAPGTYTLEAIGAKSIKKGVTADYTLTISEEETDLKKK